MPGDVNEENGIVRRNRIDILARGKALFGPESVIPAGASDPFTGFCLRDGGGEALLHFGDGRRAVEANRERILSSAAEMDVRVVEAGHDEVAAQIDDASSLFGEGGDFVFVTDDENFFATHEDGGSPRCLRVVRIDA